MMRNAVYTTALMLSLTGCTTVSDLPLNLAHGAKTSEGLAIVSLALSGKSLENGSGFDYWIRPVPPAGKAVKTRVRFDSALQAERWVIENQPEASQWKVVVKDPNSRNTKDVGEGNVTMSRVVSMRLAAGEYEFYGWQVMEPNRYGRTEYSPELPFSYRFTVEPGETVYIGRLNVNMDQAGTVYDVTVEDRRERDLAVLEKKTPSLQTDQVVSRVGRIML